MTILAPDQAERIAFETLLNRRASQDLVLRLYRNDHTPGRADTEADYVEADFPGYAPIALAGAAWTLEANRASQPPQSFVRERLGVTQHVYGYWVTQRDSGLLVTAERFEGEQAPYPLTNAGDSVTVTPVIERETI